MRLTAPTSPYRMPPIFGVLLAVVFGLFGTSPALAAPNSLCSSVPPASPAPPRTCVIGGSVAATQMRAACATSPSAGASTPSCTPVPSTPQAKATYWQALTIAPQTLFETARLEGWSSANDPSQGIVPGVCYNDQAGNGTVGVWK